MKCVGPLFLAVFALPAAVLADRIILTSGRTVEGIITEEDDKRVVVEVSSGISATLLRERIKSIERSGRDGQLRMRDAWRKSDFLHRDNVPAGMEKIAAGMQALQAQRAAATSAQNALSAADRDDVRLRLEAEQLKDRIVEINRRLEAARPDRNVSEYNALVGENNTVRARMVVKQDEINTVAKTKAAAVASVSEYIAALQAFDTSFSQTEADDSVQKTPEHRHFVREVRKLLEGYGGEFRSVTVDTLPLKGGGVVVSATVNGSATGRFLVDTGADLVTISEPFARKLGLSGDDAKSIDVFVAGGSKVKARPVTVASMSVGNAGMASVSAIVIPTILKEDIDGLLGMSFLRHFVMHFDGASGRMTLKQFAPKKD